MENVKRHHFAGENIRGVLLELRCKVKMAITITSYFPVFFRLIHAKFKRLENLEFFNLVQ